MMSLSAYGRRRGCSHEAVRRAIKSGRLQQSVTIDAKGHPKINDPDLADQEWGEHTSQIRQVDPKAVGDGVSRAKGGDGTTRSSKSKPSNYDNGPAGAGAGDGFASAGGGSTLNKARAARETYEARISELKYKKMKGESVDAAEVKSMFATAARRVRDSALAIPDRIASVLAAEEDPDRVHRLLTEELEQALTTLADHGGADVNG